MVVIKDYEEQYAKALSKIIVDNMYEINIKEHGKDVIDRLSKHFTEDEIKSSFPKRTKCFVALDNDEVVGTASINHYRGDETGNKYIIQTVFVRLDKHRMGIGTLLMEAIEKFAISISAKEVIIPASVYACDFYRKFGFDFLGGKKVQNEDKEFTLVKYY